MDPSRSVHYYHCSRTHRGVFARNPPSPADLAPNPTIAGAMPSPLSDWSGTGFAASDPIDPFGIRMHD